MTRSLPTIRRSVAQIHQTVQADEYVQLRQQAPERPVDATQSQQSLALTSRAPTTVRPCLATIRSTGSSGKGIGHFHTRSGPTTSAWCDAQTGWRICARFTQRLLKNEGSPLIHGALRPASESGFGLTAIPFSARSSADSSSLFQRLEISASAAPCSANRGTRLGRTRSSTGHIGSQQGLRVGDVLVEEQNRAFPR